MFKNANLTYFCLTKYTMKNKLAWVGILCFLLIISRLIPHPPNFTATLACLVLGGVLLNLRIVFPLLMASFWISDLAINNILYAKENFIWFSSGFSYLMGIYFLIYFLNRYLNIQANQSGSITLSIIASSTIFFILSNLVVWMNSSTYSSDWSGLMTCYLMAIPFYGNEVLGSLFYSILIWGAFWLSKHNNVFNAEMESK